MAETKEEAKTLVEMATGYAKELRAFGGCDEDCDDGNGGCFNGSCANVIDGLVRYIALLEAENDRLADGS